MSGVAPPASEDPRYRVEIPFRTATHARLACPFELPDGARVEARVVDERPVDKEDAVQEPVEVFTKTTTFAADGSVLPEASDEKPHDAGHMRYRYRYCVTRRAASAQDAIDLAQAGAMALLHVLAARHMGFELGPQRDRYIRRLDPPTDPRPDTELDFDTVNMSNADKASLAARFDPTGERRRQGKILTSNAEAVVTRHDVEIDSELYAGHENWGDRITRAAEVYRLAQHSNDLAIRFLLSALAFEVLVAHQRTSILSAKLNQAERKEVIAEVDKALANAGLDERERERIRSRIQGTEVQSYTMSATAYLDRLNLPAVDLVWVQRQRGALVHAGTLTESSGDANRRNDFINIVGLALQHEMARAAGRTVGDLALPTTITSLQVWDQGDGGDLTLRPR